MQDILFNTDTPAAQLAEFYDLSLVPAEVDGGKVFLLQEIHGWWDAAQHGAVIDDQGTRQTAFKTYREGLAAYCKRIHLHGGRGFFHSFVWHPVSGAPSYHHQLKLR